MLPSTSTPVCVPTSVTKPGPTGDVHSTEYHTVKSMHVHCVVEQLSECSGVPPRDGRPPGPPQPAHTQHGAQTVVEMDTYAILPCSTMFNELIRSTLIKVGYTAAESVGAKGSIQIKNWKPLPFDAITDNHFSTLEDVLGELTSVATLRIQLCSHSKVSAVEEIKEKLLRYLLGQSQGLLSGCPIEKKMLLHIARGDHTATLPDGARDAFNKWYRTCNTSNELPPHSEKRGSNLTVTSKVQTQLSTVPSTVMGYNAQKYDSSFSFRTRARTSFDVENEIPRLQKWFAQNQHPSRDLMIVYLEELNSLESRKEKKPLDLTNIIYWFKNARAAIRRSAKFSPGGLDDVILAEDEESPAERLSVSTSDHVPVLPNRNAIYVVNPLPHSKDHEQIEVVHPQEDESDMGEYEETEDNIPYDLSHNSLKSSVQDLQEETNNNHVPMEQEEATDLSIAQSKKSDQLSLKIKAEAVQNHRNVTPNSNVHSKHEECADGDLLSGTSSSQSLSPQSSAKGLSSSPALSMQSPHTALQMAAMSHAISMHYIHPASLYQNSSPLSGFSSTESTLSLSPTGNESLNDRKKRSRVFIDPLSEIPKLEKWFEDDTHPSSYMIEKYTEELNRSTYRQRFPHLEPKNVQLWFKNHRAKVKRQRLGMEVSSPVSAGIEHSSPLVQHTDESKLIDL